MLPLACTHFWIKLYTGIAFEGALALRSVWAQCLVHFAAAKYPSLHKLSTRVLFYDWTHQSEYVSGIFGILLYLRLGYFFV